MREFETAKSLDPNYGDSSFRERPPRTSVGDFLTPLERSRLKVPTGKYEPLVPRQSERVPR